MASGTHTFGLETFAEPQVLPPPPVRHALLVSLVALAAILHFGTASWSDIHNGAEGFYAATAQRSAAPSPNEPPLLHWLLLASYKLLGVNVAAARVPIALAFVASVALTFLNGERLGGYWRGFVAGVIYLGSCGAYMWARFVTPEPIFAVCLSAAILCAIAGYQRKQTRRRWFAMFWLCAAAAYLTRGAYAVLVLAAIIAVPAFAFREARLRFAALFHWSAVGVFFVIIAPWLWFVGSQLAGSLLNSVWVAPLAQADIRAQLSGATGMQFLPSQLVWLFPTLVLVLPAVLFAWRKVIRPHEFEFTDALPLCWTIAGFLPLVLAGRQQYDTIPMWTGFALFAAWAWHRSPTPFQLAGIVAVAVIGIGTAFAIAAGQLVLPSLGQAAFPQGHHAFLTLSAVALVVSCAAAGYLVWKERETLAITALLVVTVPLGLGAAESIARNSEYLSFARIAQFFTSPSARAAELIFEGRREAASSLEFYLQRDLAIAGEHASAARAADTILMPTDVLERMAQPRPVYLIIHRDRVPWWQAQLTARFHIYHQVASCGMHVVVSNHQ